MKRSMALLVVMAVCLSLCACGAEKQTVEINYGEEYTIELKNAQEQIVWESANPDIVTVKDGIVTGIAPGNSLVTAAKDGKSIAEISVTVNLVDIAAILFSQTNVELELEETIQLQYVLMPDNASDYGLSWKSANPEIAEVDSEGNIRAVAPGATTIICSSANGILDTCEVVVREPSAIEQLNEYEKWLFDVMIAKFLPSFYNAPAARIRKIESYGNENFEENMILLVNIQGTNRLGGTLYKDFMILCKKDINESSYLPMFTDDGLYDRSSGSSILIETTKLDYTKVNAALEEYWAGNVYN